MSRAKKTKSVLPQSGSNIGRYTSFPCTTTGEVGARHGGGSIPLPLRVLINIQHVKANVALDLCVGPRLATQPRTGLRVGNICICQRCVQEVPKNAVPLLLRPDHGCVCGPVLIMDVNTPHVLRINNLHWRSTHHRDVTPSMSRELEPWLHGTDCSGQ
jgi:hypothetical protein